MDLPGRLDVPTTLVIPCHDEAARLDGPALLAFVEVWPALRLLLVNDGSHDGTAAVLDRLAVHPRVDALHLPRNVGKAEAVRQGVLAATAPDAPPAEVVGWWDADLAAPLDALPTLVFALLAAPERELILGSRVRLLGVPVRRRPVRHYVGRIGATLASLVLGLPVYDTQCGAKVARADAARALFAAPFHTTWTFDVEVLARLIARHPDRDRAALEDIVQERPLPRWSDVPGSHVRWTDVLRAPWDLARIWWTYRPDRLSLAAEAGRHGAGPRRTG
jgi:dolichyl-phosphate beta-glucosyltransferase